MDNNLFNAIFDFSFSKFVSIDLVRVLYAFTFIVAGLAAIGLILAGFAVNLSWGIGSIILAPILYFLIIVIVRVFLEMLVVLFRIAENTREIADNTRQEIPD
jgi:uncharacterized membrane protein